MMNIPNDYSIWFLPGGAHLQFAGLPMNIAKSGK
jgi:phosphoserine aminotransferase